MSSKLDVDLFTFIVLAERAGINRVPTVLSYSNYGTLVDDVPAAFETAERDCLRRGLIDGNGQVSGSVWEMLGVFSNPAVEYDLRFSTKKGSELRVAVSQSGQVAVRSVLDGDRIVVERLRVNDAIPALAAVLPEVPPVKMQPLSVDLAAMRSVMADAERRGETDQRWIEQGLRSRGANVATYKQMTKLLDGPKRGAGEIGVTIWHGRREFRAEQTVRLLDLESGRVALYNSGNDRMLAPCDLGTFKRVLGGLTTQTQRKAEW